MTVRRWRCGLGWLVHDLSKRHLDPDQNIERLAKGELTALAEEPLDGLEYRKLKCVMKSELMLDAPPRGSRTRLMWSIPRDFSSSATA